MEAPIVKVSDARFPSPFGGGVEYAAPARGAWNIVHIGMLLPESHQIFVCAQSCLRGVVLTAAEMGASERFSTIAVCENDVLFGDMEDLIIDGVADILGRLPKMPRAVLVFTSCIHHFMGCDLDFVYAQLRKRFPAVHFTDCYMYPIMRKSKTPPDPMMRKRLYSFLERPARRNDRCVNIIGNLFPTLPSSDFMFLLSRGGYDVRDITRCETFDEYLKMAESRFNIAFQPTALPAMQDLKQRLGTPGLYMPLSYDAYEIRDSLAKLAAALDIPDKELQWVCNRADDAFYELKRMAKSLGGMPVAIDYTAAPRVLGLAEVLLDYGVNVRRIYADSFTEEERPAFERLKAKYPDIEILPTVHPKMGLISHSTPKSSEKILAIGQKAAYFCGTPYFVNLIDGALCGAAGSFSLWGFDGLAMLAHAISDAAADPRDMKRIIQVKGWGCCC